MGYEFFKSQIVGHENCKDILGGGQTKRVIIISSAK